VFAQRSGDAEAGGRFGDECESRREVQCFGGRTCDNVECRHAVGEGRTRCLRDELRANTCAPRTRLDGQSVEFGTTVLTREHNGEANHLTVAFRDQNVPGTEVRAR